MDNLGSDFVDGVRRSTRVRSKTVYQSNSDQPKKVSTTRIAQATQATRTTRTTQAFPTVQAASKSRTQTRSPSPRPTAITFNPNAATYSPARRSPSPPPKAITNVPVARSHRSPSPITKYSSLISRDREGHTAHKFLLDRINIYNYVNSISDLSYFLNIKALLAKIEPRATGIVCLSNTQDIILDNKQGKIRFAIKIAENKTADSSKEIYILQQMLQFVHQGYYNLPIIYKAFQSTRTRNFRKPEILRSIEAPEDVKKSISDFIKDNKNYNIYINELAKGDLKNFLNEYDKPDSTITENILLNAVAQIFMAIASLHDIGVKHNDTHYGNFLYHKIEPGGYIKYTIGNKSYYIENLGYLWVIWDFGISTQLNGTYHYFGDYEMLSLFLRQDEGKYNMRFAANNENGKVIRRHHGNLNFKHRPIPETIVKITSLIENLSRDKKSKTSHIVPIAEGDALLSSKKGEDKAMVSNLSGSYIIVTDDKNKEINEISFLTEHIIPSLSPAILHEKRDHTPNDHDILFHVILHLDNIKYETMKGSNGREVSDYPATIAKYNGRKIIIPMKYY